MTSIASYSHTNSVNRPQNKKRNILLHQGVIKLKSSEILWSQKENTHIKYDLYRLA